VALAYRRATGARRQLAQLFGQYVPPELVDEMSRAPERYTMGSRSAVLTVLFADVSGFSSAAKRMPPAELGAMMNLLFSHLTDVVRAHRGTLDKYIGDSVMAFWGAPLDDADHARHAVDAAQAMLARLPQIHAELAAKGWPALQLNIGINTGTVVVGDMGSRHRRAYTVMGDAVNLAARLQGFCSRYGLGLVVGDATHNALRGRPCLPLGPLALRGLDAGHPAWQPLAGLDAAAAEPVIAAWKTLRRLVRAGRPAEAMAQIDALAQAHPALGPVCRWQRMLLQDDLHTGSAKEA
jgi:adenylate cyclase